jgi:hypothetical protein
MFTVHKDLEAKSMPRLRDVREISYRQIFTLYRRLVCSLRSLILLCFSDNPTAISIRILPRFVGNILYQIPA